MTKRNILNGVVLGEGYFPKMGTLPEGEVKDFFLSNSLMVIATEKGYGLSTLTQNDDGSEEWGPFYRISEGDYLEYKQIAIERCATARQS